MLAIHKKALIRILLIAVIINTLLNGFFAWLVVHEHGHLPVMGLHNSVAFDFFLTGVLMGFLLAFLSSSSKVKKAVVEDLPPLPVKNIGLVRLLPINHFKSALVMAVVGVVIASLFILGFVLLEIEAFKMPEFIAVKIAFAVLLALLVEYLTTVRCWSQPVISAVND